MGQGAAKDKATGLNMQQELFCQIMVSQAPYFNASKAAVKAGYTNNHRIGNRLTENPAVKARIDELRKAAAIRTNIVFDDIINEYAKMAFFDPSEVYNEEGEMIPVNEFPARALSNIGGIDVEEIFEGFGKEKYRIGELKKVRFNDNRITALDRLRDCLGWKEKNKVIRRNAEGVIIETEETESAPVEDKVVFEDHSGKA